MVAGFAEDIDSEDDSVAPAVTNHIDDDLDEKQIAKKPQKPSAAIAAELTSSEEEENEDNSDEDRKKGSKRENERSREKKGNEAGNEGVTLKLEMPVSSASPMLPVEDGFGLGSEDVDDWLNSPDTDPKVLFTLWPLKPLKFPFLSLYVSNRSIGENLLKYQWNLSSVIMSSILVTTLGYNALISQVEISCWSLLGFDGLIKGQSGFVQSWEVFEFSLTLNLVAWKAFFNAFWLSKAEYKSGQRIVKVIYIKCSLFHAIITYQFKTSELKKVEKLVKQTVQALKFVRLDWECACLYNLWDYILVGGPWKSNVDLEKSLKNGCNFCTVYHWSIVIIGFPRHISQRFQIWNWMGLINFVELDFVQRFIFLEEKRKAAPNENCHLLFGQLIFSGTI